MDNQIMLSVIIPTYLEEENLRVMLPQIQTELKKLSISYEIIVVDTTTSMDETKIVCTKNSVRYINRKISNSYGDAVRTGIKHSLGEYLIFMDADGSHPPEFISQLYSKKDGYDVIIASRYIEGGYTENTKISILLSHLVNKTYQLVLGLNVKDVSNSFRLYKSDIIKNISLTCNNFDILEEILFKLRKSKIKEIPFTFKKRKHGQTKRNTLQLATNYLNSIIKLRLGK